MEKRLLVIIIAVVILAVAAFVILMLSSTCGDPEATTETTEEIVKVTNPAEEELAGHFKLSDYEEKLKLFPREENFGPITDIETLLEKTKNLWVETYGMHLRAKKPYLVYFDEDAGAWHVTGGPSDDPSLKSGSANILVDHETGDVLAVWHTK